MTERETPREDPLAFCCQAMVCRRRLSAGRANRLARNGWRLKTSSSSSCWRHRFAAWLAMSRPQAHATGTRRRGSGDTSRWTRTSPARKLGTSWYKQLAPRDLLGPLGTSTLSPPQAGPRVLEIWDNNGCRHNRHAEASAQRNLEMQSRHRAWCVLVGPTRADAEASVQRTGWRSVQAVQGVPPQRESARQTRLRARSLAAPCSSIVERRVQHHRRRTSQLRPADRLASPRLARVDSEEVEEL